MRLSDVSVPEIYQSSADFRFFLKWFAYALSKLQYDTENLPDIYDPQRCPSWLLWMLADTMGFKYDDRLPTAYNRLVLLYFMSMIRNRGSKDGMTLAAEVNLAQFNILDYGREDEILYDRLDDTSIPVNAVNVTPHTAEGYIDVVYFSDKDPIDACIEYVRPVGMYINAQPGVRVDAKARISIDARLTNINDAEIDSLHSFVTHVGHYSRSDFARLQKSVWPNEGQPPQEATQVRDQQNVYYRNSEFEGQYNSQIDPGFRTLYSLQLCNNEHIVKSLIGPVFGLGYGPVPGGDPVTVEDGEYLPLLADSPKTWNLRYDKELDESITTDVVTVTGGTETAPTPAINPIMTTLGDAMPQG